jgi:radical SAM protein (TIGR04043 family)/putative N-acetyltransferase (TIGR04045 family)
MIKSNIVVELQSLGLRINREILARRGGAGPAEGATIVIDGRPVTVPTGCDFVSDSPFVLEEEKGQFVLLKNEARIGTVALVNPPRFYLGRTADGLAYKNIALLHGRDCLASTVIQTCVNWQTGRRCRFCGIELSLTAEQTSPVKTPEQLAEVALEAQKQDGIGHVALTTGASEEPGIELGYLAACIRAVKEATHLPVHAQLLPPDDPERLWELKEADLDTVGIHIESFDFEILSKAAPHKSTLGLEAYVASWKKAVEIFGPNQVSSFLIAGLGEKEDSIIEGSVLLADLGVYPFVVPLRPIPGSLMEQERPPDPALMIGLYEEVAEILKRKRLHSGRSLAGCVRCGACSALPFFEHPEEALICHPAQGQQDLDRVFEIRRQVFVGEQKIVQASDRDAEDLKSTHLVARLKDRVIGTVRVFAAGSNGHWVGGRLAVEKEHRRGGAGELLVREAVRYVKKQGCSHFTAHIQAENVPFFLRLGWKPIGPLEDFHGRPHQLMEADLGD